MIEGRVFEMLLDEFADCVADRLRDAPTLSSPAPEPEQCGLLDLEAAAAWFGRSTRWVRQRSRGYTAADGSKIPATLPYVRLDGGALAFLLEDLQAFAAARRVSADGTDLSATRVQTAGDPASGSGSGPSERVGNRRVTSP